MKTVRLILMLFILPVCALAQGAQYTGIAQTVRNMIGMGNIYIPIPGASVNVCTGVYTGTACPSGGNVMVYSNQSLTTALVQPLTADNYGNFSFWAAPGTYYFTVTGQGASASSYQLTLPFGISGTYNAAAKSIENTRYSDQYNYPTSSASDSLTGAAFSTITPNWGTLPTGLTSGGFSRVSITGTAVTWVAGDQFNPNWLNKSASINDHAYTIASCASTTSCTLTASYTNSTTYGPWMTVGTPTSVYISGGTGTAEAVTVLGIGASECPGGTAKSICGIPANSHSGSYSVQSATAGIQEAINDLAGAGGRVMIPAGTYNIYATIYSLHNSLTLLGHGKAATFLTDHVSGGLPAILVEGNYDLLHGFEIIGDSTTGNLIDYWDTGGFAAWGNSTFTDLSLSSSTGTGISITGASMPATAFYSSGAVGYVFENNLLSLCQRGITIDSNGGAGADGSIFKGNHITNMVAAQTGSGYGDGVFMTVSANITFVGNRFDFNQGVALHITSGQGVAVVGNYFENNNTSVSNSSSLPTGVHGGTLEVDGTVQGMEVSGNEMTQYDGAGDSVVAITPTPGSVTPSQGVHIAGNYIWVNGHSGTAKVTSIIFGGLSSSSIVSNVLTASAPAVTPTYGVDLLSSGNATANASNIVANAKVNATNVLTDENRAITIPWANPNTVTYDENSVIRQGGVQINGGFGAEAQLFQGSGLAIVSGDSSNIVTGYKHRGRIIVGDGTGYGACFSTYAASVYTDLGCILDHGNTLAWAKNGSVFDFTVDGSGNTTIAGTVSMNGGGSIASGKTLTNNGTITGGTVNATTLQQGGAAIALASQLPLSGSVAGSTTALAANTCGDTVTQTVTGAATTMTPVVTVSGALPTSGLVIQAAVTATNTVSIEYCNVTTAPITPAAATLEIRVVP